MSNIKIYSYNNYANRIVKKEDTLSAYDNVTVINEDVLKDEDGEYYQKIKDDFSSIPAYFSIGYGIDLGAYYSLCNRLDIGFTWHDALTFAHVTESTIGDLKFEFGKAIQIIARI